MTVAKIVFFFGRSAETDLVTCAHPVPANSAKLEDWMMLKWSPVRNSTVHLETTGYAQILEPL